MKTNVRWKQTLDGNHCQVETAVQRSKLSVNLCGNQCWVGTKGGRDQSCAEIKLGQKKSCLNQIWSEIKVSRKIMLTGKQSWPENYIEVKV